MAWTSFGGRQNITMKETFDYEPRMLESG